MVQAVVHSTKITIILGAFLVLLLAVACSSDNDDGVTGADISDFLAAAGSSELAAQLLRSGSGANTGIWVNGSGKATGYPDLGIISLGVEALADTASEARGMAAVAIDQTIAVLKSNRIEERDMLTSQFSIIPRYTTQEVTRCSGISRAIDPVVSPSLGMPAPDSPDVVEMIVVQGKEGNECRVEFERVLISYQVTNTLTIKVRDLNNMGNVIDEASEAADDLIRVNRVSFTIEDTKPLQNEAREEAIADLLTTAATIAELAGVELGQLVYLTESGGGVPQSFARIESAAAFGFADSSTSILAGELDVSVNVQAVFGIAN